MKSALSVVGLLWLVGCGSSASTTPAPGGNLSVTVSGLPASLSGDVALTGPSGDVHVAATTQLTNIPVGTYAVTAAVVSTPSGNFVPSVSAPTVQVSTSAAASVTVTYAADSPVVVVVPGNGFLSIDVSGLPAGADAALTVTGADGGVSSQAVTGTGTLSLPQGSYTLAVSSVRVPGQHVSTIYDGKLSASSVTVDPANPQTIAATYAARPGTGHLWAYASVGPVFGGFDDAALSTIGSEPTASITVSAGKAFILDHASDGWLLGNAGETFFSATDLVSGVSTLKPSITQATDSGGVIDGAGNLWLSPGAGTQLYQFAASTLNTASPTPAVMITIPGSDPIGVMAFDHGGALWVGTSTSLLKFTPAQLTSSGSPTPAVTITGAAINLLTGMAFDAEGNLFFAAAPTNASTWKVLYLARNLLSTSGMPTPTTVNLQTPSESFNPRGMAFDEAGDLWLIDASNVSIFRLSAGQIYSTGTFAPAATMSMPGTVDSIAFDPPPQTSPLAP